MTSLSFGVTVNSPSDEQVVEALDSLHSISAFQGCGLVFDNRVKGKECWPHKDRLFCYKCNRKQISSDESDDSD